MPPVEATPSMPVLLLFLLFPVFELWLMIKIGSQIGALTTIALLILAGMAGMALLRTQGDYALWKARDRLARGDLPPETLFDGILLAFAGLLLFVPGFLSDVFALMLLVPPFRHWAARKLLPPMYESHVRRDASGHHIIEGEWRREDDPPLR
jgi:UPF0716 protein FxsA